MDTRTGEIIFPKEMLDMFQTKSYAEKEYEFIKEMILEPTKEQLQRKPPSIALSDDCPCGSGLIFGKCCYKPEIRN